MVWKVAIVAVVGLLGYLLVSKALALMARRRYLAPPLESVLRGAARWTILVFVVLIALQQVGVETAGLWAAVLTVGGMIAIGFVAVWSVLSNILCAVLLTVFRPFRVGDQVEIIEATGGQGLRGRVVHFNILYTCIKESGSEGREAVSQVPNNLFFQKTIRRIEGNETQDLDHYLFEESRPAGDEQGSPDQGGHPDQP
jgi:small-conductance mechanosensitive channel